MKKISSKAEPAESGRRRKEMDKIANDMAVLFENKIKASKLGKWLAIANDYSDAALENTWLTWQLGYEILPVLIDAKTQEDAILFLKKALPVALGSNKAANKCLCKLCENYFKKNNGLSISDGGIHEFMDVCLTLFSICEKFEEYVCYLREEMKEAA